MNSMSALSPVSCRLDRYLQTFQTHCTLQIIISFPNPPVEDDHLSARQTPPKFPPCCTPTTSLQFLLRSQQTDATRPRYRHDAVVRLSRTHSARSFCHPMASVGSFLRKTPGKTPTTMIFYHATDPRTVLLSNGREDGIPGLGKAPKYRVRGVAVFWIQGRAVNLWDQTIEPWSKLTMEMVCWNELAQIEWIKEMNSMLVTKTS